MNEKIKAYIDRKDKQIYDQLTTSFGLPTFGDDVTKNELENNKSFLLIVYGDIRKTNSTGILSQEMYIVYVSENNPEIETVTLDIISTLEKIKGVNFERSIKERLQKGKTEQFVDRVTIIFSRMLKYER